MPASCPLPLSPLAVFELNVHLLLSSLIAMTASFANLIATACRWSTHIVEFNTWTTRNDQLPIDRIIGFYSGR